MGVRADAPEGEPYLGEAPAPATWEDPSTGRKRGARRLLTVGVAAAVVVGAGGFVASTLGAKGGASSPTAAVQALVDAAAHEDALGALATVEPSERETLRPALLDAVDQM